MASLCFAEEKTTKHGWAKEVLRSMKMNAVTDIICANLLGGARKSIQLLGLFKFLKT